MTDGIGNHRWNERIRATRKQDILDQLRWAIEDVQEERFTAALRRTEKLYETIEDHISEYTDL